jgi:hypothetical protein
MKRNLQVHLSEECSCGSSLIIRLSESDLVFQQQLRLSALAECLIVKSKRYTVLKAVPDRGWLQCANARDVWSSPDLPHYLHFYQKNDLQSRVCIYSSR